MNDVERGQYLINLYVHDALNYLELSKIFKCTQRKIKDYLQLVDIRRCTGKGSCGKIKSFKEFHQDKRNGRYYNVCKQCWNQKCNDNYWNNPKKHNDRCKSWYNANLEKHNNTVSKWKKIIQTK